MPDEMLFQMWWVFYIYVMDVVDVELVHHLKLQDKQLLHYSFIMPLSWYVSWQLQMMILYYIYIYTKYVWKSCAFCYATSDRHHHRHHYDALWNTMQFHFHYIVDRGCSWMVGARWETMFLSFRVNSCILVCAWPPFVCTARTQFVHPTKIPHDI